VRTAIDPCISRIIQRPLRSAEDRQKSVQVMQTRRDERADAFVEITTANCCLSKSIPKISVRRRL